MTTATTPTSPHGATEATARRYLVYGGWVDSRNDHDSHFVSAHRLVQLYGLNPRDCLLTDREDGRFPEYLAPDVEYMVLRPRYDGNYTLPEDTDLTAECVHPRLPG